jgi:hypothetical protein
MLRNVVRKPSPAMCVALLALFVALGGTGYAAAHYRITSTKQIKPNVLRALKGKTGAKGPAGAAGAAGATHVQTITGSGARVPAYQGQSPGPFNADTATCPSGTTLIGGGGVVRFGDPGGSRAVLSGSSPSDDGHAWVAEAINQGPELLGGHPSSSTTVIAYALCASP